MVVEELWHNFLDTISNTVNPASYAAWFNGLKLLQIDNDMITIQVPLDIHKKMLGDVYYSLIDETLFKISGINYDIRFVLEEEWQTEQKEEKVIKTKEVAVYQEEIWDSNLNLDLNFDNFIVGDTNRLAKVAGMAVAEQPGKIHNPLFIYGKSGLGKTHLMHAIGNFITEHSNKRVLYTTSDMFMNDYSGFAKLEKGKSSLEYANHFKNKYRNVDVLIIDDIQYLVGAEKTQIIISSDRSPEDLKILEERLRSRFMWGLPVDIYPPDFDLRVRIIKQKIKGTSIADKIDEDVIEFIANSCQNDVRFLEGTVNRLMAYTAMIVPDKIDLKFANDALKDFIKVNIYSDKSIASIQKVVAEFYHVTVEDLKRKKRSANIAYARQIGMYLSRMLTEETCEGIGLQFGGRDHSTVIYACDKITEDIKENKKLELEINEIKNKL